jgi:hypothetical protein
MAATSLDLEYLGIPSVEIFFANLVLEAAEW